MVQIRGRCKLLQLISPINTDHVMFISGGKPVLSCSKKIPNSKILWCLNVIALSNSYMYITSGNSRFNMNWDLFLTVFTLNC